MAAQNISAVLTTWNNAASIRQCLDSLRTLPLREKLLCDCGSTDGTVGIIEREYPEVAILCRGRILSFAQARNLGLNYTSAPLILFLEGDWFSDASSLRELEHTLLRSPDLAIAVPRYHDGDEGIQIGHNVRRFPTTAALCVELLLLHKLLPEPRATRHYRMIDFDHRSDRVVDHACGAFILARRLALAEAGGYDENYAPAWMEDVDLSRRLARSGWKTMFCSRAAAHHSGRETTRHLIIENRYDDFYRSVLRYACQYLQPSWHAVRAAMIFGMLARISFACLFPRRMRRRLLDQHRIHNSDEAIQRYRHMYFRALKVAIKGERDVSPGKPAQAASRLPEGPCRAERQTLSPDP